MVCKGLAIGVVGEFLWFSAKSLDCTEEGGGSIVWLASVNACVATVVRYLTEWERRRGHRQYLCADTQREMLKIAKNELIGKVRGFLQNWTEDEVRSGQR